MPGTDATITANVRDLYSDHHNWLQRWLGGKLGCSDRAADLMHDTFLRLLTRGEYTPLKQPRAYLQTIAKRVLIDHWRREHIEKAYLEALANRPDEYAPGPEEKHLLLETLVEIDRRLSGLPIVVKRAFLLAQLSGCKQHQIAEELEISLSTVKRHLVRAYTQCYFALDSDH
ncbi:sigma-70 family RNA polymerase sigma factor [Spongiibacter tropicus]|uniref:sigma-70 family RNA polymerase sigma factor n=1 Tax=Spongiibacter tropicus TaxID=454602 RepID=UPI0003B64E6C|nr:sigma-70 family RNA polymerase sigma factor [Spongiibacter tropicus]